MIRVFFFLISNKVIIVPLNVHGLLIQTDHSNDGPFWRADILGKDRVFTECTKFWVAQSFENILEFLFRHRTQHVVLMILIEDQFLISTFHILHHERISFHIFITYLQLQNICHAFSRMSLHSEQSNVCRSMPLSSKLHFVGSLSRSNLQYTIFT